MVHAQRMRISELSAKSGKSRDTKRFHKRNGLIKSVARKSD